MKKILLLLTIMISSFGFSQSSYQINSEYDLLRANAQREWHIYMDNSEVLLKNILELVERNSDSQLREDLKKSVKMLYPLFDEKTKWVSTYEVKTRYKKARRYYKKAIKKYNRKIRRKK